MPLLRHSRIYTSIDAPPTDALLVRSGRVVAVGDDAKEAASREDETIDLGGACVFPALCDAHVHLWGLGLRRGSVALGEARSTEDVYDALRADGRPRARGWVLGHDWDQHRWEDGDALDIDVLNALFPQVPLMLRRVDGHALWVNDEALRRAAISPAFDPGAEGHVGRREDGRLSGLLVDDAMNPVLESVGPPSEAEDREVFLESCALLRSHGVGSAHVAWMPLDRLPMLQSLRDAGELPLRLHLYLNGRDPALSEVPGRGPRRDEWLTCAGVKFFADGALGSCGAHLHDPYPDGTRGLVVERAEELARRCAELAEAGWQPIVHAIGDAAVSATLDAFAAIDEDARRRVRPRVEHAQMVAEDDLRRFASLGVIASIQPIHMHSDATWAPQVLKPHQLSRLFPWRRLLDEGVTLCAGSDYPIEDPNPWHGIATAVTRRDRTGARFRDEDALTRREILRAYTEGAAYAGHREHELGRLDVGYRADFAVLSRDPLRCADDELWSIEAIEGGSSHL